MPEVNASVDTTSFVVLATNESVQTQVERLRCHHIGTEIDTFMVYNLAYNHRRITTLEQALSHKASFKDDLAGESACASETCLAKTVRVRRELDQHQMCCW